MGTDEAQRLDLAADEAWWQGRVEECISLRESAYRLYDEAGDSGAAGYAAVWLYEHYAIRTKGAIAGAWLQRARRSLADDTECIAYGALTLREAEAAHGRGELVAASDMASAVIDLGRRLRSADLEAEALQTLGRLYIDQGRVREGLAHLDEAMLFAVEGRLGPYSTGKVYCSLISACEELGDFRRAAEWTEATAAWAESHPFAIFPGVCAYVSQIDGPFPSASHAPSIWYDEVATPQRNPSGNRRSLIAGTPVRAPRPDAPSIT